MSDTKQTVKAKDIKVGDKVKRPGESTYRTVTEIEVAKSGMVILYLCTSQATAGGRGLCDRRHPNYSYKAEVAS